MQRLNMKNNKIRYKSMKRSSPMVQYKRFLLGKHYRNFKSAIVPIPKTIQVQIADNLKAYAKEWANVQGRTVNTSIKILERVQHERL